MSVLVKRASTSQYKCGKRIIPTKRPICLDIGVLFKLVKRMRIDDFFAFYMSSNESRDLVDRYLLPRWDFITRMNECGFMKCLPEYTPFVRCISIIDLFYISYRFDRSVEYNRAISNNSIILGGPNEGNSRCGVSRGFMVTMLENYNSFTKYLVSNLRIRFHQCRDGMVALGNGKNIREDILENVIREPQIQKYVVECVGFESLQNGLFTNPETGQPMNFIDMIRKSKTYSIKISTKQKSKHLLKPKMIN